MQESKPEIQPKKYTLAEAKYLAECVKQMLTPHCYRVEIAGSIRRGCPFVKDIEIVCIPKPYETGLFASGVAEVVNLWPKVKGELPCKYTQRILPEGIKLDLFFAEVGNFGLIFAIRTGSADYSHKKLATRWVQLGFNSKDGYLHKNGKPIAVTEEKQLFKILQIPFQPPDKRNL